MSTRYPSTANAITAPLVDWCLDALSNPISDVPGTEVDLSMLTVVVPSLNRQSYLLRQIRFWSSYSARLTIVDGSNLPIDDKIKLAVDAHPRMTYLHYPTGFAERLNHSLS